MVLTTLTAIGAVILALVSLGFGVYFLVRYARTKKIAFLVIGLLLTLIVPGLFLCLALVIYIPSTMIAYGPPPISTP